MQVHTGHRARLRQRAQREGLGAFHPHEALELLLFYPIPQCDLNPLAHELISRFGSLTGVLSCDDAVLSDVPGVGAKTVRFLKTVREAVARYRLEDPSERAQLGTLSQLRDWYCATQAQYEGLSLVSLNLTGRLLGVSRLYRGDWRGRIGIRQIADPAVRYRAQGAVLIAARQTGGIASEDLELARAVVSLFSLIRIALVDYVVFSASGVSSMRENGILRSRTPASLREADAERELLPGWLDRRI